jgi:hypothetical protein
MAHRYDLYIFPPFVMLMKHFEQVYLNSTSPSVSPAFSKDFNTKKYEKLLIPSTPIFFPFTSERLFPLSTITSALKEESRLYTTLVSTPDDC